jgi:hypothetical protein
MVNEARDQTRLLAARDHGDVDAMRAHAWRVWQDLQGEWERWPSSDVVLGARDRIVRALQPIRVGERLEVEEHPVMFAVLFDPVAAEHVARIQREHHTGALPAFPRSAIAVKPVWYAVHRDRVTEIPIWDNDPAQPDADGNPSRTWRRTITIDPSLDASTDHNAGGEHVPGRVPVGAFLYRVLETDAEVTAARGAARDPTLAAGDYLVVIAMHVSTKEIPDWVWATFWWHDHPDGPFGADRPATLTGPAASYLMDVAYSAETPREADGSPHVAMNPWLEGRFPDGLHSNCVACHQRAALGAVDYLPVTRGVTPTGDPYFDGKTTTDFVWSLALER